MATGIQLERRRLNEEIENAFITSAQAAANVEMKIISGKGNVFYDFLDFHTQFNYLVRLTSGLPEMTPKDMPKPLELLKGYLLEWLHTPVKVSDSASNLEMHCRRGLRLFDEYYNELMHCGIISLPTRKG
jgi:hypothetical protein